MSNSASPARVSRSAYVVQLSVEPGGSRRCELFALDDTAGIEIVLRKEFLESEEPYLPAYLALWYGEHIRVFVVQEGVVEKCVDVREHLFVTVHDASGGPLGLAPGARVSVASFVDSMSDEVLEDEDAWGPFLEGGVRFELDWTDIAAALPALRGERIAVGTELRVTRQQAKAPLPGVLTYGFMDVESGERNPYWAQNLDDPRFRNNAVAVARAPQRRTADDDWVILHEVIRDGGGPEEFARAHARYPSDPNVMLLQACIHASERKWDASVQTLLTVAAGPRFSSTGELPRVLGAVLRLAQPHDAAVRELAARAIEASLVRREDVSRD